MKKILITIMLLMTSSAWAEIADTSDYILFSGKVMDSTGNIEYLPDSVRIIVIKSGTECYDAWYNLNDSQADTMNGELVFYDQIKNIDNDQGNGWYLFRANFFYASDSLYQVQTQQRKLIAGINTYYSNVLAAYGGAGSLKFKVDSFYIGNDNLKIKIDSLLKPTTYGRKLDVTATGEAGIDLSNIAGTLDASEVGTDLLRAICAEIIDSLMLIELSDTTTGDYLFTKILNYATSALKPTIVGRTLDVTATGTAGVDLDNIEGTLADSEVDTTLINDIADAVLADSASYTNDVTGMTASIIDSLLKIELSDTVTGDYWATYLLKYGYQSLKPTTVGRTIDITSGGNAGIDLDNIAGTLDSSEVNITVGNKLDFMADSILYRFTMMNGNKSKTKYNAAADTIWVMNGNDTLWYSVYFHPDGAAGDAPDSVKFYNK